VLGIIPQVLSLEACMQMAIPTRTTWEWKATILHPQPSWIERPQGVYPNPNYSGGGVLYYPHL